jgi:hypothetical protein
MVTLGSDMTALRAKTAADLAAARKETSVTRVQGA